MISKGCKSIFPIKHQEIWDRYKQHIQAFWTPEEVSLQDDLRDLQNKLRDKASYRNSQVGWKEDEYEALEDRIEKKRAAIKDAESRTRVVDKHGSTLTKGRG